MKRRIAILTGGTSSEREVALASAKTVGDAISARFAVSRYVLPEDLGKFISEKNELAAAIPVMHGRGGEDGQLQEFLEAQGVPYVFSGVQAHALAIDKDKTKKAVVASGVNAPTGRVYDDRSKISFMDPVAIKPIDSGSSIGVSLVRRFEDLESALDAAFQESSSVLVEDLIEGDEYTVAVVETVSGLKALPVVAIRPKDGFFDYAHKYEAGLSDEVCPAPISEDLTRRLQDDAIKAHEAVGARHVSRSDFIVDDRGRLWFLEINTIPGMTSASLLPKAIAAAGLDFGDLLAYWIEDACIKMN
jgi:D-alanine-D-alanine ligase